MQTTMAAETELNQSPLAGLYRPNRVPQRSTPPLSTATRSRRNSPSSYNAPNAPNPSDALKSRYSISPKRLSLDHLLGSDSSSDDDSPPKEVQLSALAMALLGESTDDQDEKKEIDNEDHSGSASGRGRRSPLSQYSNSKKRITWRGSPSRSAEEEREPAYTTSKRDSPRDGSPEAPNGQEFVTPALVNRYSRRYTGTGGDTVTRSGSSGDGSDDVETKYGYTASHVRQTPAGNTYTFTGGMPTPSVHAPPTTRLRYKRIAKPAPPAITPRNWGPPIRFNRLQRNPGEEEIQQASGEGEEDNEANSPIEAVSSRKNSPRPLNPSEASPVDGYKNDSPMPDYVKRISITPPPRKSYEMDEDEDIEPVPTISRRPRRSSPVAKIPTPTSITPPPRDPYAMDQDQDPEPLVPPISKSPRRSSPVSKITARITPPRNPHEIDVRDNPPLPTIYRQSRLVTPHPRDGNGSVGSSGISSGASGASAASAASAASWQQRTDKENMPPPPPTFRVPPPKPTDWKLGSNSTPPAQPDPESPVRNSGGNKPLVPSPMRMSPVQDLQAERAERAARAERAERVEQAPRASHASQAALGAQRVLGTKAINAPLRPAPPPPPKMSMLHAVTATAGAAATTTQAARKSRSGTVYINGKPYRRLESIGKGGSCKVYKVTAENGKTFAMKKVTFHEQDGASTINGYKGEIDLLNRLAAEERVIRLYDSELNEEKNTLTMLMELGETDFANLLTLTLGQDSSLLNLPFLRYYWSEMLLCVQAVHSHNVIHSDLKPANFLLVRGKLKLIDFGIANAVADDTVNVHRETQVGTLNYMAPENFMQVAGNGSGQQSQPTKITKLGAPSDVWSLGCILYQMTYGRTPFWHLQGIWQKANAIKDPNYQIEYPETGIGGVKVPACLINTLKGCLTWDKDRRPTIDQLLQDGFLNPDARVEEMMERSKGVREQVKSLERALERGEVERERLWAWVREVRRGVEGGW